MPLRFQNLFTGMLVLLIYLSASPPDASGAIIVTNRNSKAKATANPCDHPFVQTTSADTLSFSATHSNSASCADGTANGTIQYADSLSFTPFGSLASVVAGGTATCSETQFDDQNRFIDTTGGGTGSLSLIFEVTERPATFVFDGTATLEAIGPASGAEVEFSILSTGVEHVTRIFVRGDSTVGPVSWNKTGELQPGFYSIRATVRAVASSTYRLAGIASSANVSMNGVMSFTQENPGTVVNSTGDGQDNAPGDGVCDTGGPLVEGAPECTLRAAIMEANATAGLGKITFSIPLSDPGYESATDAFRIKPKPPQALPSITRPILIDATTQGRAGAANPQRPTVILDGVDLGTASDDYHGLDISAGGSDVRGLSIVQFNGHGIYLRGLGDNKIHGNFIGIAPGATTFVEAGNNRDGIRIEGVARNLIGGLPTADRNVISNNGLVGTAAVNINILGSAATSNTIIGNYIGTGDGGMIPVNNTTGVLIDRAPNNAVVGNVIAGNQIGIRVTGPQARDNQIEDNLVGIGADGALAVPNHQDGIVIDSAPYNTIGGPAVTTGTSPGNVISSNGSVTKPGHGIRIVGAESKHTTIRGNLIGTDRSGTLARGNRGAGIFIDLADSNEVGGPGLLDANVVSANGSDGIVIQSDGNSLTGNFVGTSVDGFSALGNMSHGVRIHGHSDNLLSNNVVSGNDGDGILIEGDNARRNKINDSLIGISFNEFVAMANQGSGVAIQSAHENVVEYNLISGNQGSGVALSDSAATNVIRFNLVGTDGIGNRAVPNSEDGIRITNSPFNEVNNNTVSGNGRAGVHIGGDRAEQNRISFNWIGLASDGLDALGNGEDGVFLNNAPRNSVTDNLISANGRHGAHVLGSSASTVITHNVFGLNTDRSQILGNAADGVRAQLAERTRIRDNVITASGSNGVSIVNGGTATQDSVWANTIFNNGLNGVLVSAGTQVSIRLNDIYQNGLLGIDLAPQGRTPNDGSDLDTGPNNLQNYPVLQVAFEDTLAGTTVLMGYLDSTPNTTFKVEIFDNVVCDGSGYGEGQSYLEWFALTTGANGSVSFMRTLPYLLVNGIITTTVTDDKGNSSEFSNCVVVEDRGSVFVVNSPGDASDTNPGDGSCNTGATNSQAQIECTLRAAIEEVNAQAGSQKVIFAIPGNAPHILTPATSLPDIVGPAVLDATTQSGFAGSPVVEIDGRLAGPSDGLTLVGGGVSVRGFAVYGFGGTGVVAGGTGSHIIERNFIGLDAGTSPGLGNTGHGIWLNGGDNHRVGSLDPGATNVIAFNGQDGVHVSVGRTNSILTNSIHSNGSLGINLVGGAESSDGVTSNDSGDGDTGPNDLLNFAVLDHAYLGVDQLELQGTIDGTVGSAYRIEVFGNAACDSSTFGEGERYLGSFDYTVAAGSQFTVVLPLGGKDPGAFVTTSVTDAAGNTSEFSACASVTVAPLSITLGVLPNPYLSQYLDIYMVASQVLDGPSVALTVGGVGVPMELVDSSVNLWKGDYEILDGSVFPIRVCAASLAGSSDCDSTVASATFATGGNRISFGSGDGRFFVRASGSDVLADGYVVILPAQDSVTTSTQPAKSIAAELIEGNSTDESDVLSAYLLSASNLAPAATLTVEFWLKDLNLPRGLTPSRLVIHGDDDGPLDSILEDSRNLVWATAEHSRRFELRIGAVGSGRTADATFLRLLPNYPNPFNPSTMIQFEVQTRQHVRVSIYDVMGRRIARLLDEVVPAGTQKIRWTARSENGGELASGVYFLRLETSHGEYSRKVVLIR